MKLPISLIALILFLVMFSSPSCTSVSKEELIPPGCDTVGMTYQADVVPILQNHCYTCHSAVNPFQRWSLWKVISICIRIRLTLREEEHALWLGNISHLPGYNPMPFGESMLDTCLIHQIVDWVNRGAQNN